MNYIFLAIGKIIGPIWFILVAQHFRKAARNAVYNHVLNNDLRHRLNRLWQRKPEPGDGLSYTLTPVDSWVKGTGHVYWKRYHKVELWALFWLVWVWLDDDSVSDTYDDGHAGMIPEDDSKAFDHGDWITPRFKWWPALRWNMRNTTMNYKYYFMDY